MDVKVGDILLLELQAGAYHIVCVVTHVPANPGIGVNGRAGWQARHLFTLGEEHDHGTATWWGPDDKSWKSITNLGPCIPEEVLSVPV